MIVLDGVVVGVDLIGAFFPWGEAFWEGVFGQSFFLCVLLCSLFFSDCGLFPLGF